MKQRTASTPSTTTKPKTQPDARVSRCLEHLGWPYYTTPNGDFFLEIEVEEGRRQIAVVNDATMLAGQRECRVVYSCGSSSVTPFSKAQLQWFLLSNTRSPLGAWTVTEVGDLHLAIFSVNLDVQATPAELAGTTAYVASAAHAFAKVFGADGFLPS
jgi:hypothetical protein